MIKTIIYEFSIDFVTVLTFLLFFHNREHVNWLWKTQWELINTKLWKSWEKMGNLILKSMVQLKTTNKWLKSLKLHQSNSQRRMLMPFNIQIRLWKRICYIKPQTNHTDKSYQNNKTCQTNISQDQRVSRLHSTVATLSTLD